MTLTKDTEDEDCIECGALLKHGKSVDTKYGKVCIPCYDSGDTGEPYVAVWSPT